MKYPFSASMPYSLGQIVTHFNTIISEQLDAFGITVPIYRALVMLKDGKTRTLTQLAESVAVDHSTLSRQVSKMVQSGLVSRVRPEENGRVVWLTITETGREMIEQLIPTIQGMEAVLTEGLTSDEVDALTKSLQQIERNLLSALAA